MFLYILTYFRTLVRILPAQPSLFQKNLRTLVKDILVLMDHGFGLGIALVNDPLHLAVYGRGTSSP